MSHFERIFENPAGIKTRFEEYSRDKNSQYKETLNQRWPQKRELEIYSTPVKSAKNRNLGRIYVFRDVTHEKEVEQMKSEFVSLVSHELRTPLTSIVGYLELLLEGDVGELKEDQADFLQIIKRNADRLTLLGGDLLEVSRVEAGAIKLQIAQVDLISLLHGVVESLRPQIESKNQVLKIDMSKELPAVQGDANRIVQVVTNLLSNAHNYTPFGGSISVFALQEKDYVRIGIQDTGIGLSEEEQKNYSPNFSGQRIQKYRRKAEMVSASGLPVRW